MKRLTIVAIGAVALGGCTGTHIKPVSVCDGTIVRAHQQAASGKGGPRTRRRGVPEVD